MRTHTQKENTKIALLITHTHTHTTLYIHKTSHYNTNNKKHQIRTQKKNNNFFLTSKQHTHIYTKQHIKFVHDNIYRHKTKT